MWLLLLLIRGLIFFSFFSISSSALSVNKESIISKNGKDIAIEGSGSIPTNEILSDDEDFYPDLMKPGNHPSPIEFSGDGSLDRNDHENIPGNNKGHTSITSDTHNPGDDEDDGDNEDDEEDDDDDDDEGSGDSPIKVTNGGSDFSFSTKETITDDNHFKPYDNKPDTSITHPDETEDKHNIPIDEDESSNNFFPDVIETSTKQHKPNHDIDHEDHDQDPNTLGNDISLLGRKQDTRPVSFFAQPSMLAVDENGYIIYCPCMGRFGNQAEQFLGSLLFAKYLDRTLVLPPFIGHRDHQVEFSSFDDFFKLEPLLRYHKVIPMEDFMANIAPKVWLENTRFILCYGPRKGDKDQIPDCNPFHGSPFKPFWHHFNITRFQSSIFHQPLITQFNEAELWKEKYKDIKTLAFVGAPSSFPTNQEAVPLQKYLHFSDFIADSAAKYREVRGFTGKPYLGVHLRHGSDWIKACSLLKENEMDQLFSSDQCIQRYGVDLKEFKLPYELCSHSINRIVKDINRALADYENTHKLEVVYIATDYDDQSVWQQIHTALPEVTLITPTATYIKNNITRGYIQAHYIIDTYLLSYSNYFIGNCVSSFSAFASRIRLHSFHFGRTTHFFASDLLHMQKLKDEL